MVGARWLYCGHLLAISPLVFLFEKSSSSSFGETQVTNSNSPGAIVVTVPGTGNTITINPGNTSDQSATSRPLQKLSDTQLRETAIDYAAKLRTFETNIKANRLAMTPPTAGTPAQQKAASDAFIKQLTQQTEQEDEQFSSNYLGNARALRSEIIFRLNRLGILSPYVDMTPFDKIGEHVLDFGVGRGANPFTCAANYLEKLARRLPP
jgi:hypothetical protein